MFRLTMAAGSYHSSNESAYSRNAYHLSSGGSSSNDTAFDDDYGEFVRRGSGGILKVTTMDLESVYESARPEGAASNASLPIRESRPQTSWADPKRVKRFSAH